MIFVYLVAIELALSLLDGAVVCVGWDLVVKPTFVGAPNLSVLVATAMAMMIGLVTFRSRPTKKGDVAGLVIAALFNSTLTLLVCVVVYLIQR